MSVATRNPFALLDDDDPSPPSPPPPAPSVPPAHTSSAPAKRARGGPASHGGKYYSRGGGARQNATREQPSDDPPVAPDAKQRRSDGERREGRGRGRGSARGRGRTYDKHSATGKTDSDKKLHNGWGGDDGNTELKVEEAATTDAAAESGLNDWNASANADASVGGWDAPPQDAAQEQSSPDADKPDAPRRKDRDQEEEDNTLTLEQYIAQQKEKDSALLPKLETRKANDGQDGIWDGVTLMEKGETESYFSGKTKSAPKARTEKKEKVFIEIEARFERPSRGGRGRGAPGGDRGESRGGRGSRGRGARGRGVNGYGSAATPVNVDDETAFPSLS